jgi:hypothetical protein
MLARAAFAGLAALFTFDGSALAQAAAPTTPSAMSPYSASGSGLPQDPVDMSRRRASPDARQHGSDSAAQTQGSFEEKAIAHCKAMPAAQAIRDPTCAALMKKHPTMLNDPQ